MHEFLLFAIRHPSVAVLLSSWESNGGGGGRDYDDDDDDDMNSYCV